MGRIICCVWRRRQRQAQASRKWGVTSVAPAGTSLFFYPSLYDPFVVESNKVLAREELDILRRESDVQLTYCTDALQLSRSGNYLPLLRFRHVPGRATRPILIDNKQWKEQLILSFSSALALLRKSKPQDDSVTSAMLQFVGMATKVLHRKYYTRWFDWHRRRAERRETAKGSESMSLMLLRQRYYGQWLRYLEQWRQRYLDLDALQVQNLNWLRLRYFRRLRSRALVRRLSDQAVRCTLVRYFRHLHYRAVVAMLQRTASTMSHPSLSCMALIGGETQYCLQAVVAFVVSQKAEEDSDAA